MRRRLRPAPLRPAAAWVAAGLGLAVLAAAPAAPAAAQALRIATSAEPTSADPHNYRLTPNSSLRDHLFEGLTGLAPDLRVVPRLAESWAREDDRTWVFRLREGVRFHDGTPLAAQDVVFTACRVLNNPEEVTGSYSSDVRRLAAVEARDARTVVVRTPEPEPLLDAELAGLAILPRTLGRAEPPVTFSASDGCAGQGPWPNKAAFDEGRAVVGTGPFRLRSFARTGPILLDRHEGYWGDRPHWAEVRVTPVTQAGPRLAGLLAGDSDLAEAPATADLARLRADPNFAVAEARTTRLIFLQLDTAREASPTAAGGAAPNPLRDARVRRALSLALDRRAIAERLMDGTATPTVQVLHEGMNGVVPGVPVPAADPARARALLAEAGFPAGFAVTISGTNNRYVNDARLLQAVAQMWQRVGVRAEVDAMPAAAYFGRRARREFSVALGGYSVEAEDALLFFRTWLATTDRARGAGTSNYGGWSDPDFDAALAPAMVAMDREARGEHLRQAGRVMMEAMPVVPIHFEGAAWAMRRGLAYAGRADQVTLAQDVRPR